MSCLPANLQQFAQIMLKFCFGCPFDPPFNKTKSSLFVCATRNVVQGLLIRSPGRETANDFAAGESFHCQMILIRLGMAPPRRPTMLLLLLLLRLSIATSLRWTTFERRFVPLASWTEIRSVPGVESRTGCAGICMARGGDLFVYDRTHRVCRLGFADLTQEGEMEVMRKGGVFLVFFSLYLTNYMLVQRNIVCVCV